MPSFNRRWVDAASINDDLPALARSDQRANPDGDVTRAPLLQ
jgi:hypothetical protein